MAKNIKIPTFQVYRDQFNRPNWLDDPRTPIEETLKWLKVLEDRYYELYGDMQIKTLRRGKEGE